MRKTLIAALFLVFPLGTFAAGGGVPLDEVDIDLHNKDSLQRGARLFVNYCLSCHSAAFMRYNRMGQDLGLSDDMVMENLMFIGDFSKKREGEPEKVGATMEVAMHPEHAKDWFGTTPPDLSVIARSRGANWLYTYLRSFYVDDNRPFGVNNTIFPEVSMPHVMWEMEGMKTPIYEEYTAEDGTVSKRIADYEYVTKGTRTKPEFDSDMRDLVNFMVYMGEPAKLQRYSLGIWVLLFLALLFVVSYALKKEYWKDVH